MATLSRDRDEPEQDTPEELVTRAFSRCHNWPREQLGILGLAQGLRRATDRFSVPMEEIVTKCAELSQYCPTDVDMFTVAREIRDAVLRANQPDVTAQWYATYGTPEPFDWQKIDHAQVKRVRDMEREMLAAIRAKYPGEIGWHGMAVAARELGYPDYAAAWEKGLVK